MRKLSKTFIPILFALLLVTFQLSSIALAAVPSATSDFYVNDFAGVFSDEEKTQLMNNAIALSNDYDGIQVVVSTVESLDGNAIEDYCVEMYNQYEIGKNDMGLLILLSTGDREIRIETGLSMEAYINDSKAGRIMDKYAIPYLKENNFSEGLINLQKALIDEIVSCVEAEKNNSISAEPVSTTVQYNTLFTNLVKDFSIVMIVFSVIVLICILSVPKYNKLQEKIKNLNKELENTKSILAAERNSIYELRSTLTESYSDKKKALAELSESFEKRIANISEKSKRNEENLQDQLRKLSEENANLNANFATLTDRYERANKLYPNVDNEITAMIEEEVRQHDMKMAQESDSLISKVINLTASKDIVSELQAALSSYSSLSDTQKSYSTSDINKLQKLYDESSKLKEEYERKMEEERIRKKIEDDKHSAQVAVESVNSLIASIDVGKAKDITSIEKAMKIYTDLNDDAQKYFDESVLNHLKKLLKEASDDRKREEEIERNKMLAAAAVATITGIIAYISYGKANDLRKLKEAKRTYENLSPEAQQYVDSSTINKLNRLISEAKRDKEEEESARRRREAERRSNSYHSSSFGGHSGFGGRSGGGGASRKF